MGFRNERELIFQEVKAGTTTKTSNPPKTGDTANAVLWIAILVLSAAGITGVRIWNKKKQVKRLGIEEKKEEKE